MRPTKLALALLLAAGLAACGGNGSSPGDQTLKVKYSAQVSFGDSLSDVGSYAVGAVKQLGGGKFTINGDNSAKEATLTGKIWLELMAAQFGLAAPCAAQTGLEGDPAQGFAVPVMKHTGCYAYAQGGSRVTDPIGPNHKATGSPIGATTVPVATQIANHLAVSGGKFSGTEIVFIMGGGNDALALLGAMRAGATAAGEAAGAAEGEASAAYAAAQGPKVVAAMAAAGSELAALVKTQVIGKGANYVVVNNLPDLAGSPAGRAADANTRALIGAMVKAFNDALKAGIGNESKAMYVDLYAVSVDQMSNPGAYGLSNTTGTACAANALGTTSLVCNASNVNTGDVSHYLFADEVHPTPFTHTLIARYVSQQMVVRGWL